MVKRLRLLCFFTKKQLLQKTFGRASPEEPEPESGRSPAKQAHSMHAYFFKTIMENSNLFRCLNYKAWTGYLSLQHRYFPPTTTFLLACYKNTILLACLISSKLVFISIEKCTMQKKILRHIKLTIHAWSTKCGKIKN
jgi:hypothetical protein